MTPLPVQRIGYRVKYYYRKVCHFFGFCPKCRAAVNFTSVGRAICPQCGK